MKTEQFATRVAAHYHGDEKAIDPATIELVIMVILEVIKRCKNRPDPNQLTILQRVRLRFLFWEHNKELNAQRLATSFIDAARQTEPEDLESLYEENRNWLF